MNGTLVIGIVIIAACAACGALALVARRARLWAGITQGGLSFVFPTRDFKGERIRALRIGGANQSATYVDDDWYLPYGAYIKHFDCMFGAAQPIESVLMLGGGGYSYPKYALSTNPDIAMDVVEIDPKVTELARRFFYLDKLEAILHAQGQDERLGLITADAKSFVETCSATYDAILNDTFLGARPDVWLCSAKGLRHIKRLLAEQGVYVTNVIAPLEGAAAKSLHEFIATLEELFAHVHLLRCLPVDAHVSANNLVIATDGPYEWHGAIPSAALKRYAPMTSQPM